MSKGSNSSTTSTAPNAAAMQSYNDLLQRAGQVSNTPYQAFGGEETAPVNAQQTTGIDNVNAQAGFANPFVMQGESSIASGSAPLTAAGIQQYMSPYTQSVIDATQSEFNNQNAQQQSQVTGNAAAQGALGGNRVGVAQALTAQQQQLAQAPVIAGLYNTGYNNAVNTAQQQQQTQIQGGQAIAGTGIAGQTAGLQGAGAQIGAGTLQQTTQQTQDTQARTDYYQAQGYPFQTAQWLAGIDTGVGSQMGGTSNTQGPQPNQFVQAAGLGLAGASMFLRHGGRIPGFAAGGSPSSAPWGEGQGWVPTIGLTGGKGAPEPPKLPGSQNSPFGADAAKGLGALAKKAGGLFNSQGSNGMSTDMPDNGSGMYTGDASQPGFAGSPGFTDGSSGFDSWYASGGRIPRRGFADGGVPVSAGFGGSPMIDLTDLPPLRTYGPDSDDDVHADKAGLKLDGDGDGVAASNAGLMEHDQPSIAQKGEEIFRGISGNKPDGLPSGVAAFADDGTSDATDFSAVRRAPTAPRGVIPPGVAASPEASHGLLNLSDEARQGLISMGLGMMANTRGGKGSFLTALGQGGEQGMTTYASAKAATALRGLEQQKLQQARESEDKKLAQAKLLHETMTPYQKLQIERENLQHIGNNDEGYPIYLDKRTGKESIGATKVQGKAPSGYVRNPDGSMSAVKGGPADPEIVSGLVKAKSGAQIPDATADFLAERVINGDSKALVGLGRGAQGAENIVRIQSLVAQKAAERGMNASDILAKVAEQSGLTASQRTFGTQTAKMAINSTEAEGAIHQGLEVSQKVPRTKFVPINKLVQMAEANISDPDLLEFRAANLAIINTYARAISPTGVPTVNDKQEAMKNVSEATSPEAYERVMRRMLKEIEIAHAAPAQAKRELERIRKSSAATVEPSPVVTAPGARPTITSKEEFDNLPSGSEYIRNGNPYRKP